MVAISAGNTLEGIYRFKYGCIGWEAMRGLDEIYNLKAANQRFSCLKKKRQKNVVVKGAPKLTKLNLFSLFEHDPPNHAAMHFEVGQAY